MVTSISNSNLYTTNFHFCGLKKKISRKKHTFYVPPWKKNLNTYNNWKKNNWNTYVENEIFLENQIFTPVATL